MIVDAKNTHLEELRNDEVRFMNFKFSGWELLFNTPTRLRRSGFDDNAIASIRNYDQLSFISFNL